MGNYPTSHLTSGMFNLRVKRKIKGSCGKNKKGEHILNFKNVNQRASSLKRKGEKKKIA